MTIEECIKQIKERVEEVSQIIKTALDNSKRFNKEYYDYKVSLLLPNGFNLSDQYLVYDIYARYKPQSSVIYLDNILLPWNQLDDEEEILRQVEHVIEDNCRNEEE